MLPAQAMISQTQSNPGQVYNDLNGLQGIRTLGKTDQSAALMQVAKQFESMFVGMMLSSMRQANKVFEEDSLFHTPESDFYQQMYDDQMSLSLSGERGMGLAQVIYRQLMGNYGKNKTVDADEETNEPDNTILFEQKNSSLLQSTMNEVDDELTKIHEAVVDESDSTDQQVAATGSGNKGKQFSSPQAFVAAIYPQAQIIGQELGVDPRAIVAQAALETGWGKYVISDEQGRSSFNFFGIKADSRWDGESVDVNTHEYHNGVSINQRASFRSYESLEAGMNDYVDFLQSANRYEQAVGKNLSADHYGHALQAAGYATDPLYGAKIQRISDSDTLNQALDDMLNNMAE